MNFGRENAGAKPDEGVTIYGGFCSARFSAPAMSRDNPSKGVRLADVSQHQRYGNVWSCPRMPQLLTDSTLFLHHHANDYQDHKARLAGQPSRVETWITSFASPRSAAGLKGRPSVTRSRATSVSSSSSIAVALASVCTNAESQVSEGFICSSGSLEEEDEKCGYPSQDRDILRKRAREMAGVRGQTLVHYIF
jgi:hypothetical protein